MKTILLFLILTVTTSVAQIDTISVGWWSISGWSGGCSYTIDNVDDPVVYLYKDHSYYFDVNTFGHHLVIEGLVDSLTSDSLIYIPADIQDSTLAYHCLYSCEHPNNLLNHNCWMQDPFQVFNAGNIIVLQDKPTSVKDNSLTTSFELNQNYPNPFNPQTLITYSLKVSSNVRLTVYNLLGQKIKTLIDSFQIIGNYELEFDGSNLNSGVYFYRLETENFSDTKRMVIMK